jgi:hypothetical protein
MSAGKVGFTLTLEQVAVTGTDDSRANSHAVSTTHLPDTCMPDSHGTLRSSMCRCPIRVQRVRPNLTCRSRHCPNPVKLLWLSLWPTAKLSSVISAGQTPPVTLTVKARVAGSLSSLRADLNRRRRYLRARHFLPR